MADDALELALRALRWRDYSARELGGRLEAHGLPAEAREHALETLSRTGLLDDRRFAESRAASLAGRGAGDALIRHTLASAGIATELVDQTLATVEPELERARAIVRRRGKGPKTARYLRGKGFCDDVVGAVAGGSENELG